MSFQEYYTAQIYPQLITTDILRKKLLLNYSIIIFVLTVGFVAEAITWMLLAITVIVVFIFWYTYHYSFSFNSFHFKHEDVIYENVVKFFFPHLKYERNRYIKLKDLKESLLISGDPQQYSGSHLITWNFSGEHGMISYINSNSIMIKEDGQQRKHEDFNGIVCIAHLPAKQKSTILLLHQSALLETIQNNLMIQKIEDHINEFIVYSDSVDTEDTLIKGILAAIQLENTLDKAQIFICLQHDKITIALSKPAHFNYIKSSVVKTVVNIKSSKLLYKDVRFIKAMLEVVKK